MVTVGARGFWNGKRVFITGHTGFKGSWLALWLARLGARVFGYSLPAPTEPSLFRDAGVDEVLDGRIVGDVRDAALLSKQLRAFRPDVIFHMAAQSLVRTGYAQPAATFDVNVMGTVQVLDAVRQLDHRCALVVVTTDKCYENSNSGKPFRETDPLGGHDPYSASKAAAELAVSSYWRSYCETGPAAKAGIAVASVRAGNVIGGGDWAEDRIVPDLIRACLAGTPVTVRNPSHVRPWQHVLEPLSGYLTLAERMVLADDRAFCGAWNFGPSPLAPAKSVCDLVTGLRAGLGCEVVMEFPGNAPECREASVLLLDITKAHTLLGWEPRWDFDTTVAVTAAWYKRHLEGAGDARERCMRDIAAYESCYP